MDKKFKILIADRNKNVCALLQRELEHEGYQVQVARDGGDLLMTVNTDESPDLVVMGLDLPLVDGMEVLERLQNRLPPLPVVIHSSMVNLSEQTLAKDVIAFVEKGESLDSLKDTIADALKKIKSLKNP